MKHQLKPLTILTGEENGHLLDIMSSIFHTIVFLNSYKILTEKQYLEITKCCIFNIPERFEDIKAEDVCNIYHTNEGTIELPSKGIVFLYFPEAKLHPAKQRILARYIARLVNAGVYFVIATHSDILVHEFNNLILFGANEKKRKSIEKEYSEYKNTDGVRPEDVGMYITRQNSDGVSLESISIDKEGFDKTTFDKHLSELVDIQTMMLYGGDDE